MASEWTQRPCPWPVQELSVTCSLITDGSHLSPKPQTTGLPIGNVKDMTATGIDLTTCTRITPKDFSRLVRDGCAPMENDVLLSKDGTIGKVLVWSQGTPMVLLSSIAILRPKETEHSRFLAQMLQSNHFTAQLYRFQSGSALKRLVLRDIACLRFPRPDRQEQTALAGILDTVDEAIRQTAAVIGKLKKIKAGLLHELLTRGIDADGQLRDPVRHPEQFKDSPLGKVPETWEVKRLGKLCDLLNGMAFKPSDWKTTGLPIIRIQNLNGGQEFNYSNRRTDVKYLIPADTLLFSWSGNRGTSFGPFIWPGPTGILNQHIFRVYPADGVRQLWFFYALDDVRQRVERAAHGAIGLVHVRRADLVKYLVAKPDPEEQERIEGVMQRHDDRAQAEAATLRKLTLMKQGLMQDLLTGRVRVPMVKTDTATEPSTVREVPLAFKRSALAAEIVAQMYREPTFGHVKFMKTLYLVEQLAEVDLGGQYHRAAAGPLDNRMIRSVDSQMKRQKWFDRIVRGTGPDGKALGYAYVPMENVSGHRPWFEKYWGTAQARIQEVIDLLRPLDTRRCEIVATLYEAWRDLTALGREPRDEAILDEVLTNWTESKQAIPRETWLKALGWMRMKSVLPSERVR